MQTTAPIHSRIAPTPSGYLHMGNAYSFLITYRLVKEGQGSLLLRIDDMDSARMRPEYLDDIFETLDFLGIEWDEGPRNPSDFLQNFSQALRLEKYQPLLGQLTETGLAYACTCSRMNLAACQCRDKLLPLQSAGAAWRIHVPTGTHIHFSDEAMGDVNIDLAASMPGFVVRKKDGMPSYQVCSLADDIFYGINYIVRGEDLLDSTAAQLYLANCLQSDAATNQFSSTRFLHHPLIKNPAGEKLSKSAGDTSIKTLRQKGVSKNQLLEMLGL